MAVCTMNIGENCLKYPLIADFVMTSLAKILDSFWRWRMRRTPEFASLAGNTEFDSCLETWTEDRFNEDLQTCLSYKKQLDDLVIDDPSQLINAKLFRCDHEL